MLIQAIVSLLLTAAAIALVSYVIPGVKIRSFGTAVVVALVYAVLGKLLFKLLVLLTLPLTLLTFGLFLFVINAFLLWLTDKLVDGFEIDGPGTTLLASIAISVVSAVLHWVFL